MDSVKAKPKPTFMLSHERSIVIKKSRVRMPALDTFQIDIFSRLFVAKLESWLKIRWSTIFQCTLCLQNILNFSLLADWGDRDDAHVVGDLQRSRIRHDHVLLDQLRVREIRNEPERSERIIRRSGKDQTSFEWINRTDVYPAAGREIFIGNDILNVPTYVINIGSNVINKTFVINIGSNVINNTYVINRTDVYPAAGREIHIGSFIIIVPTYVVYLRP